MSIDEKIIFTIFFAIFAGLVWLTSSKGNDLGLPNWFAGIWACPGPLFKSDGRMRKFVKISFSGFFLFWIIFVWVFV